MSNHEKHRKRGTHSSRMSTKTKSIITASVFFLAILTVILCAMDGMFVFKPGSVQANDTAAAAAIASAAPATDNSGGETDIPVHKVLITAGNGGYVYPAGTATVNDWESLTISAVPDDGYYIRSITVDGEPVGAMSYYTLSYVTEDHTVVVTFAESKKPADNPQPTQNPVQPESTPEVKPEEKPLVPENNAVGSDSMGKFQTLMDDFFSVFGE